MQHRDSHAAPMLRGVKSIGMLLAGLLLSAISLSPIDVGQRDDVPNNRDRALCVEMVPDRLVNLLCACTSHCLPPGRLRWQY